MALNFPNSPTIGDTYTTNGKTYRWDGTVWGVYGTFTVDSTASDTEPTGVGNGHIWYRSDQSQTLIRYDGTWVEVGSAGGFDSSSTSFPSSLDSGTGFAAVEALQAKVGVDGSAVTTSHDYKIADHASRLTTLEALGGYTDYSGTATYTNFTLGNGTAQLFYTQVGDLVHFVGRIILGSTSSVTGSWLVSLPVAAQAMGDYIPGTATFIDMPVTFYSGLCTVSSGSGKLAFRAPKITATYTRWDTVNGSVPMTWASGDELHFNITYKAA